MKHHNIILYIFVVIVSLQIISCNEIKDTEANTSNTEIVRNEPISEEMSSKKAENTNTKSTGLDQSVIKVTDNKLLLILSIIIGLFLLKVITKLGSIGKEIKIIKNNAVISDNRRTNITQYNSSESKEITIELKDSITSSNHNLSSQLKRITEKLEVLSNKVEEISYAKQIGQDVGSIRKKDSHEVILYGTSIDQKTNFFHSVDSSPTSVSIFQLKINANRDNVATFTIYEDLAKKVISEPNFIEGACIFDFPSENRNSVKTEEVGIAEKQADGKWKVTTPAKISFN